MFRGDGHVYMENCHVAAQIDVHNDVCGNYQYYRYRYAGMMIGTNKNMVTVDGCTYPVTEKFHATNCSVYIGDWNDYYYCELVANSLASYTHDHQMSRLTHINSVSEIQDENGAWNRTGNFLIVTVKNGSKTIGECYHIVEKDGVLTRHMHEESGYDVGIDENKDGEDDLKEDKQRIYLPFNQLFTGYGGGVTHIPVTDANTAEGMTVFEGITVNSRGSKDSAEKFPTLAATEGTYVRHYPNGTTTITLNELFAELSTRAEAEVKFDQLVVSISPEPDSLGHIKVTDTNIIKAGNNEWRKSTFTVEGVGTLYVTISDYYFCKPTTVVVVVDCATEVETPFNTLIPAGEESKIYTRSTYESDMRIYPNGGTITVSKEEGTDDTVLGIKYGTMENGELVGAIANRYVDIYCNSQPGQSVAIEVDFKVGDDVELDYFYGLVLPRGFFAKTGSRVYHRNAGLTMEGGKYYLSYTIRSESGAETPEKIMEIPAGAWVSLKAEYYFHGGNNELYYVITGSYTNEKGQVVTATTPKVTLQNVHGIKQNGFYVDMVRLGDVSGYIRGENNPCEMKGTVEFKNFKVYTTSKDINFDILATDEPAYNVKTYENDGKTSVVNAYVTNPGRNHTESWYVGNGVTFMTPSKLAHLDRIVETVDGVSNGFVALNYHTNSNTTAPYIAFNNYAQVGETVKLSARFQLPANVYMTNNHGDLFANKTWSAAGELAHVSLFNLVGDKATKDLVAMSILNGVATVFDPYDKYVYASFNLGEYADKWFTVDVSYDMATGKKSVTVKGADGKTIVGERVDVEVGAFEKKVTGVDVGYISGEIRGTKAEEYNTYSIGSMRRTLYVDDYSFVAISTTVPGSGSVGDSEGGGDDGVVEDGEGDTNVTPVVDDQNNN